MPRNNADADETPTVEQLAERLDALEAENQRLRDENEHLQERVKDVEEELEETQEELEEAQAEIENAQHTNDHLREWILTNMDRIQELQVRELEKNGHIRNEHIRSDVDEEYDIEVEEISKGGETFVRIPGSSDPLDEHDPSILSTDDLLPIQQLSRMDDEMLANATSTRPDYIAAKIWAQRERNSPASLWNTGSKEVRQFFDAGELKVWIKGNMEREDEEMSNDYAKQLASRTIERLIELSKHRLGVRKKNHRKDGLKYRERRVVLMDDAEIPGESVSSTNAPDTAGVTG